MFVLSGFADEIDPRMDEQIRVLNDLNIHHVELRGVDGTNIADLSLEETEALKKKLDLGGIKVSAIGSPLGKISIHDDFAPHLEKFDKVMQQAKILGTSYVRIFSFYDAIDERTTVMEHMDQFIKHTPDGITLLHENEKGIYGNIASRCLDLMETFRGAPLKATFDPANFIQEQQEIMPAFEMLKDHVAYVHVKDALMENGAVVPAGSGNGCWPWLIDSLRSLNYDGFLSLEPHLADFAGYKALEQDAQDEGKADMSQGEKMFILAHHALCSIINNTEEIK